MEICLLISWKANSVFVICVQLNQQPNRNNDEGDLDINSSYDYVMGADGRTTRQCNQRVQYQVRFD